MSQQNIQFKAIPGQFNIDEAQGVVECFVAGIGNKDSVGDVLITGAFTKSLTRRKPRVVWGHNWNDPIGKVLEIYEVAPGDRRLPTKMLNAGIGGLYAKVQFNLNSEKGREAFANVAFFGQEQEWSIGYKTLDSIFDPNIQANILKEVELYEVSPVLHGANQLTGTISVKSDETAEKHMPGMMMPHHEGMGAGPKIVVVRRDDDDDDDDRPIFSEGLAQALGDNEKERLTRELQARSGSSIQLVSATESTAKFRRMTSDGRSVMYRIGYHTPDNYVTFMFGKPELAEGQQSGGSRTVVPSQMPSMPMQVKPQVTTQSTNFVVSPEYVMPKGQDYEKSAFDQELENLAQILDETFDVKVGRTLSSRNMSKLKTVLETLQDIVSSAEKDVESKSNYIIPVQIEKAFETKQLLDPIFDYHRVESHVTEDGIVITTGVTQEFIEAIGVAEKALGRTLSGGLGKLGRAGRGAVNFDPKAWDGDGDGIVQEGTPYSRPAIPGVNDRASGGRVDTNAATRAWQNQRRSGMASRLGSDDNADEYDEAMGPPMRRPGRGMADDPVGDAASENLDRDRNAGAVRRGLSSSTSGSRGKPEPLKRQGEFHNGNIYDEFNGQYVEGEVVALSDIYGDDRPGYGIVGRYDSDGTGTVDYFYGGTDDEEFKTIEDAIAFLENVENEAENDRFYNQPEFRSLDRVRTVGKPGKRPFAGLASSTAEVVSKDDLPENLVNDIANAAVRAVGRSGDETRLIDGVKEVLANLTNEKLKDSVGKSVSNARKRLAEMLSDEKIIEEFQSRKAIDDFMDEVGYAVQKMLDLHVDSVKKKGTSIEQEEIEEIVDNAKSKFDDDFNKLIKASKEFWDKRRRPGILDKTPEEAKKEAAMDRNNLMTTLREGGEPEDLEATLGSIYKLFDDNSEAIISGKISLEDLNYEIERALVEIVDNDPSIDPKELANEFGDALREGASKDGANPLIVALAKEFGDEKITGGDLIDYLNGVREDSVYRPDRGKIQRENIRGFASRTGAGDEGKRPRLNEYELAAIEKMVKDTGLPRKLFDDLAVTERIGNPEDAFYQAQEYGLSKEKIRGLQSQYAKALKEAKGKRKGGFSSSTGGKWKGKKPADKDIKPGADLTGADLTDANLRDVDLTGANLTGANLEGADLTDAVLTDANLRHANLSGSNLRAANLRDADLSYAEMDGADLTSANLEGANLEEADLRGANLTNANLSGAEMTRVDLVDANLSGANLTDAKMKRADLVDADLRGAKMTGVDLGGALLSGVDLSGKDMRGAVLSGADLSYTKLGGADLRDANLQGADLTGQDLRGTDLAGANLSGANLTEAKLEGADLTDTDLTDATMPDGKPYKDSSSRGGFASRSDDDIPVPGTGRTTRDFDTSRAVPMPDEPDEEIMQRLEEVAKDRDSRTAKRRGEGTMLGRDGQIRRDEQGNIDPTEAREARAAFDQNIFNKLRELGFDDEQIELLTGVPDGGRIPEGGKPASYVDSQSRASGFSSQSRAPGKLSQNTALRRVNRAISKNGTNVLDSDILKDFLSGMSAEEINEKFSLGNPRDATNAARREINRIKANISSKANSDMDLLIYLESGFSVKNTAKLFNISPREVRKRQKRLKLELGKNIEDDDLLYLRSGLTLEETGKVLGIEPKDIRRREQIALKTRTSSRTSGTPKREMDMTLAEYAELDKVLKKYMDDSQVDGIGADEDMQVIQNILDKLDESSAANDAIPLTDKEIDDYMDTLTRMRDNGPVEDSEDKESIDKLIDSLKKTKDSKDGTYESDALQQAGTRLTPPSGGRGGAAKRSRPFKSSNGTINPHKKLDIELNDSEIGELRDELQGFIKISDNPAPLRAIAEKLEKATNGKFSVEKEEYEEVIKEIDKMRTSKRVVTSDVVGVLEQAAESQKGKYSSSDFGGGGGFSSSTGGRKNNGAPSDIPETMQKQLIMWGRQQGGLRLVQEAIQKFDQDKGTLPASYWRRLRTMYENMGPGSASGGARRSTGRNSGSGRRGRVGFSSSSDGYEGRSKRPGMSPGMIPADFEVRPRDGEPTGVGKGGAMGTKPDPKFTGDSFDQAKPEKWDELTIDEKWEWMLGEGSPEKGGTMSPAAFEGAMKKLGEEEAKEEAKQMTPEERRKARSASRASALSELSDNEKARLATEKEERQKQAQESSKRVKEEATAEAAQSKREKLLDAFNEWIDDSIRELSEMDYDETDINPDSEDIWDTVSTILGVEDITPKSLKEAIDELSSYVDITSGENAYEKKSLARANALLKKLLKMQSEYSEDKWFNGGEGGRSGFQSSTGGKPRPPRGIRPRPGTPEMPQSNAKREGDIKKLSTLIEQVVAELEAKRQNPSPKKGRMGFSSSTGKTMITDEATFFKDVENSLAKEIRAAQKAKNTKAASGLTKLQEIIKRSEASKTGDRRTNVGSIYMTMDEVDLILDGLQFALDQQMDAGGDKRIGWYSKLIEKIAAAAMSTFIDKSTTEIGSTRRTVTNKDGVKKKINIVPEP